MYWEIFVGAKFLGVAIQALKRNFRGSKFRANAQARPHPPSTLANAPGAMLKFPWFLFSQQLNCLRKQ